MGVVGAVGVEPTGPAFGVPSAAVARPCRLPSILWEGCAGCRVRPSPRPSVLSSTMAELFSRWQCRRAGRGCAGRRMGLLCR
jgi:hypothetical protein